MGGSTGDGQPKGINPGRAGLGLAIHLQEAYEETVRLWTEALNIIEELLENSVDTETLERQRAKSFLLKHRPQTTDKNQELTFDEEWGIV